MPEYPLVSIIIPTYNRAHLIGETLESVLAQTYTNWECIVVDDGSTDDTDAILKSYIERDLRFAFYHRNINRRKGANSCRNIGFSECSGVFIIFLDSDDFLEETCIENRLKLAYNNRNRDGEIYIFNMGIFRNLSKTNLVFNKDFENDEEYLKSFLKGKAPWTITCIFWKRDIFDELGGFDETFKRLQDVDLHTRLLFKTMKICRFYLTDCWYRVLDNSADYVTPSKLPSIINAHVLYINKVYNNFNRQNDIISSEELHNSLKELYISVLSKYVFRDRLYCFNNIWHLNNERKFITNMRRVGLLLLGFYFKFKIMPNFGYYKLRKFVFN